MNTAFQFIQSHRKRITLWLLVGIFGITGAFNAWCVVTAIEESMFYLLPYFATNLAACIYAVAQSFEEMEK